MQPHLQAAPADPPGVIKKYLVDAARLLAWGAYGALVYVVLVRGLQLARDTAFPLTIGKILWADFDPPILLWFPLFPVAFCLALLLPLATKYCIAFIVSIKGKDALSRWAKGILIVITLACVISTLTATGPLMVESYAGKYREAAVNGELVEARKGAEQANYDRMAESLKTMQTGTSVESAAAREGVAGWSAKVAIAKKQLDAGQLPQARYDRIERASSAAAAREDLERKMQEQQVKIATLPTASTAVATVTSDESHGAQQFASVASAWWPMVSFFALEMIAVFFGLIQLVLEMTRDRQLADWEAVHAQPTEDAGVDLRITDGTDQWQVEPQTVEYDEEGNELVKVRRRKEVHYRRKPKPKKDESQAPLNADDPRASAANQLSSEELETMGADDVAEERDQDSQEADDFAGEPVLSAAMEGSLADSDGDALFDMREDYQSEPSESLTHAQPEEDQQDLGADDRDGADDFGGPDLLDDEPLDAAPLETPDEQALWNEDQAPSELAQPENAETPLPNGEGIVVWDDEEEPTIKELLARKTEAAE